MRGPYEGGASFLQTSDIRKLCEVPGPFWPPTSPSKTDLTTLQTKSHQSPRNFGLARKSGASPSRRSRPVHLPIPAERGRLIRLLEEKHDHARAANEQADRGGSSASRAAPPGGPISSLSRRLNVWRSCVCQADFPLQTRGSIEDLIMPAPGTVACSLAIKHTYGSWWRCLRQDGTRDRGGGLAQDEGIDRSGACAAGCSSGH